MARAGLRDLVAVVADPAEAAGLAAADLVVARAEWEWAKAVPAAHRRAEREQVLVERELEHRLHLLRHVQRDRRAQRKWFRSDAAAAARVAE